MPQFFGSSKSKFKSITSRACWTFQEQVKSVASRTCWKNHRDDRRQMNVMTPLHPTPTPANEVTSRNPCERRLLRSIHTVRKSTWTLLPHPTPTPPPWYACDKKTRFFPTAGNGWLTSKNTPFSSEEIQTHQSMGFPKKKSDTSSSWKTQVWINQCVGSHNHRSFVLFLVGLTLLAWAYAFMLCPGGPVVYYTYRIYISC